MLRFASITAGYALALSIVGNPGIGALTTAMFFAAIFCTFLWMSEQVIDNAVAAFVCANSILAIIGTCISLWSAKSTNYSSFVSGQALFHQGVITNLGVTQQAIGIFFLVICNLTGVSIDRALRRAMVGLKSKLEEGETSRP